MRISIVGAGIMGLSAAWALAREGHEISLFEQGAIPNSLGSSVDHHRLIRHPYGAADGYMRLVDQAYAVWDRLWGDLGTTLYLETGTLVISRGTGTWADKSAQALTAAGYAIRRLAKAEVAALHPAIVTDSIASAFLSESGGVLFAERIVDSLARFLLEAGITVRAHTRVAAIDSDRAAIELANGQSIAADMLVVAAGPWLGDLVPAWADLVTPSRQVVVYLDPPERLAPAWEGAPLVMDFGDSESFYLVPPVDGLGIKIGDHGFTMQGHPDRERSPTPADVTKVAEAAQGRIREFRDYRVRDAKTCFYTVAPEERFIVEPVGKRTWVMTGFSGHGFKFGPLMGTLLADTLAGRVSAEAITALAAGHG